MYLWDCVLCVIGAINVFMGLCCVCNRRYQCIYGIVLCV